MPMSLSWICIPSFSWVILAVILIWSEAANEPCPEGNYGVISRAGSITCKSCSKLPTCPPGLGMSTLVLCGEIIREDTNIHCVDCAPGKSFSSTYDGTQCNPCKTCSPHEAQEGGCTRDEDTTQCKGICVKGFYPMDGRVENCTECSSCHGPRAKRVQKCIDDGMPRERQCEVMLVHATIETNKKEDKPDRKEIQEKKNEDEKTESNGYPVYGHPAMFSSFLVLIVFLIICLLVSVFRKKCNRKKQIQRHSEVSIRFNNCNEGAIPSDSVSIVNETDPSDDIATDLPAASSIRKRTNSTGPGRSVSFSRQLSYPGSGQNEERKPELESLLTAPSDETDIVDDRQTAATLQAPGIRQRSLSSSSGNKVPSIRRQHSNPAPHRDEEKDFRKSKTFSNFTSVLPGQKGTPEETNPFLSTDDDCDDVVMINMKHSGQRDNQGGTTKTVKIEHLNAEVHRTVCNKLNLSNDGKDWKTLAGRMGYSNEFVKQLQCRNNPAEALLAHWGTKSGNDVTKLIELLLQMERSDITEQLESERI